MSALDYRILDAPPRSFIDEMRRKYPTERETDELLVRKLERRTSQTQEYHVPRLTEMAVCLQKFFVAQLTTPFRISDPRWLSGGASKLQVLFEIDWERDGKPRIGIGANCRIENTIVDKNARIGNHVTISPVGKPDKVDHENYYIRDGIVIIPKNGMIPHGTAI